jgi:tRNA-splicing endonuclease subunit Sen34
MDEAPILPVPISFVAGRYLLFSVDAATWLRREHHICGVLIGTIPQVPQQNVFLGLPLQLMPEEARLLVEKGLTYVVDDALAHERGLAEASAARRRQYLTQLRRKGTDIANIQAEAKERSRAIALSKSRSGLLKRLDEKSESRIEESSLNTIDSATEEILFDTPTPSEQASTDSSSISSFGVTPATSTSLLTPPPSPPSTGDLPEVPDSYPLFKHLHSKGYFISPGLRFGCQYLVYPSDPLRFHSHFLASHVGWNEELDLMDIVGGGRLGTGVKKGYLIGGSEKKEKQGAGDVDEDDNTVRTFSIEWAGM